MVKIEEIIDDFEKDDLKACRFKIFKIVLSYNSDIKDGKPYNHELKHLLFKSNFIRNPMGKKYSSKDYEKVSRLLLGILNIFKAINDSTKETPELFSKDLKIDVRIIKDIVSIMIYLECFYKMNLNNSKRMDECETSKIPFVEQLFSIILFYQDQTYLFRENIDNYFNNTCITGMELSVANIPVNYYDKLESSVLDNFESILESTNEIVHYLYYQFGKKLEMKILDTNINFEIIQPYQNKEFEKYLYIALQRSSLCKLEEGIRFGYYEFGKYFNKSEDKAQAYIFTLEDNDKYKTRRTGIFRRQYQLYNAIQKIKSTYDNDNLEMLAEELVSIQKNSKLLDFNQFHPKINLFNSAEEYSKLKKKITEILTKKYYLDCIVKEVRIDDLLCAYIYLDTLSEILYLSCKQIMNSTYPNNFEKEICIVDISYLTKELSRIHDFKYEYAGKLIDRFIFHEKENRDDDIFAQPLLKISRTQVILSQALISSLNLDRFIERQFIRYEINMSEIGHVFEKEFIDTLRKGYLENVFDTEFKRIPNFKVNTNEIKFIAFDDKDIEFDVVAVLGDYIILTELKAVMTSYDLSDLEKRKQSVKKAIEQLQRRKESIKHDWDKIKKLSSIVLPNQPFDEEHIICIACTDSYDYTPSKNENIFITDDSTFLKYFTCPYVYIIEKQFGITRAKKIKNIWKNGYPDAKEFMEYLMNPVTVEDFFETMEKRLIPIPIMDKNDLAIFKEDYILKENPFNEERLNDKK